LPHVDGAGGAAGSGGAIPTGGTKGVSVFEGSVKENPAGESKKLLALMHATDILSAYTGHFGNLSRSTEGTGYVKQCSGGVGLH
jgi:hypothetical protein